MYQFKSKEQAIASVATQNYFGFSMLINKILEHEKFEVKNQSSEDDPESLYVRFMLPGSTVKKVVLTYSMEFGTLSLDLHQSNKKAIQIKLPAVYSLENITEIKQKIKTFFGEVVVSKRALKRERKANVTS